MLTASWFAPLPEGHIRISISRGTPRRGVSGYRLYRKLAPGAWFNDRLAPTEWAARYQREVLDRLDPRHVAAELEELARGLIPVLCCFERAGYGLWCHRALAAAWIGEGLGIAVHELGFENSEHPLRPPPALI
jgi:hypothetical protein